MEKIQKLFFITSTVLAIVVNLNAVTVNQQLCPTNKIAPHRRAVRDQSSPRTLGLIYSLLGPPRPRPPPHYNDLDDLQEQPQEDDPDDCGEIEDYDETDLSSVTQNAHNNVYNNREHRLLFSDHPFNIPSIPTYHSAHHHPHRPERPPRPPKRPPNYKPTTQRPQRPTYLPTKPPFGSGGIFGSNVYRPPFPHYPSNQIKPVHENTYDDPQTTFKLGLIGGPVGYVVGYPIVRPTFSDEPQERLRNPIRFPDSSRQQRRERSKQPNVSSNIFGSFVDLLFK